MIGWVRIDTSTAIVTLRRFRMARGVRRVVTWTLVVAVVAVGLVLGGEAPTDKRRLAASLVAGGHLDVARHLDQAIAREQDVPTFTNHDVVNVIRYDVSHDLGRWVVTNGRTATITDSREPSTFEEIALADGVVLDDADAVQRYVADRVRLTSRPPGAYVVSSFGDIWLDTETEGAARDVANLRITYEHEISPPAVVAIDGGWHVEVWTVFDCELQARTLTIRTDRTRIDVTEDIRAAGHVPIPPLAMWGKTNCLPSRTS